MARSFNHLIDFLLSEIALCGDQGTYLIVLCAKAYWGSIIYWFSFFEAFQRPDILFYIFYFFEYHALRYALLERHPNWKLSLLFLAWLFFMMSPIMCYTLVTLYFPAFDGKYFCSLLFVYFWPSLFSR